MKHIKVYVFNMLIAMLYGCGGGGGSSGSSSASTSANNVDANTISTLFSGMTVKGVVKKGLVQVYRIENGVVSSLALASGYTDEQGNYQLALGLVEGEHLLKIETSGTADGLTTAVKCDNGEGCDIENVHYSFGQFYFVDDRFKLISLVQTRAGANQKVHITALTHVVANVALKQFQGVSGQFSLQSTPDTSQVLSAANTTVALALGLEDVDFNTLEPVDLTTITADSEMSATQLQASLVAGAVTKLTGQSNVSSLDEVLDKVTELVSDSSNSQAQLNELSMSSIVTARKLSRMVGGNGALSEMLDSAVDKIQEGSPQLATQYVPPTLPDLTQALLLPTY